MLMGMRWPEASPSVDTFGLQEFFTTDVFLEAAGNGLVRSIRSIVRNGITIPVFSYVTPAVCMIRNGPDHRDFAEGVLRAELMALGRH